MTAVASPASFPNLNRPGWMNGAQLLNTINSDDARGMNMLMPRKTLPRTNSSSSVSSTSSNSSASTVTSNASSQLNGGPVPSGGDTGAWPNGAPRKRPQQKGPWPNPKTEGTNEFARTSSIRPPMTNGVNGVSSLHPPQSILATPQNQLMAPNGLPRGPDGAVSGRQPVLYLLSLNGSFERKTISVPYYPETLRIGRQTNNKTVPTPVNGFFDSKVLSRQHAEIWADSNGKIWIRDVKSSNGTFVNGNRLSPENRESEPHELQTADHLELGIDIVSEDQKTVVHHKVSAKVEHAGFISPANNVMEMSFGDLDPSNNPMMQLSGVPMRGRPANQSAMPGSRVSPSNAGIPGNIGQQRSSWYSGITTDHIIKRLQARDIARTGQFLNALMSKDDVKNMEKPEAPEPPKSFVNGNASFRSDGGKTRFSDPPAPPPSQPLPEKPDSARPGSSDVASLKRGPTEKPKPANISPILPDNSSSLRQISQLTEQLNNAKKALDESSQKARDLEELLNREREARQLVEDQMQKMNEENTHAKVNGSAGVPLVNSHSELDKAFNPPAETTSTAEADWVVETPERGSYSPVVDKTEALVAAYQAQIDTMAQDMARMKEHMENYRIRAEKAEAERDADRKTLAELVFQIRQRDEEEKKRAAEKQSRSRSREARRPSRSQSPADNEKLAHATNGSAAKPHPQIDGPASEADDDVESIAPVSRSVTVKPNSVGALAVQGDGPRPLAIIQILPYATAFGVVLFGMGLMGYINDWQLQPHPNR
ncbi:hypothetical protein QBC40DRAFT_307206 [Triangularia verruculosa]|uniref:FHA domain-containing protein n=1 Tax=Triangularia verruculosa TaxID=2587418 RepID=A0AAN7AUP1_9PEZI|nr:hypothetical protein QBC40DRAFT_307206 [Triangularia verruculosa]